MFDINMCPMFSLCELAIVTMPQVNRFDSSHKSFLTCVADLLAIGSECGVEILQVVRQTMRFIVSKLTLASPRHRHRAASSRRSKSVCVSQPWRGHQGPYRRLQATSGS